MKRILFFAACLLATSAAAHADDFAPTLGIFGLYSNPDQTIDFIAAVDAVVWSTGVDNLYAIDLDGFTFTSTDTDDQSDPVPLEQTVDSN